MKKENAFWFGERPGGTLCSQPWESAVVSPVHSKHLYPWLSRFSPKICLKRNDKVGCVFRDMLSRARKTLQHHSVVVQWVCFHLFQIQKLKVKEWSQSSRIVGKVFASRVANSGLILGASYGPQCHQEWSLCAKPGLSSEPWCIWPPKQNIAVSGFEHNCSFFFFFKEVVVWFRIEAFF